MSEWLDFEGTAEPSRDRVRLVARPPGASVTLAAGDVRLEGASVRVRRGAIALAREFPDDPAADITTTRVSPAAGQTPAERTYCLGALEFRCEDDRLLGPCVGHWDCRG